MKTAMKIVGAVAACVVVLLVLLSITGFEPRQRTPGLWLKGNLVTAPVTDWSFTEKVDTVEVETHTWYGVPHSVTTYCAALNGQLYLDSFYPPGVEYPHGRSWNENVARDPRVRLKSARTYTTSRWCMTQTRPPGPRCYNWWRKNIRK